MGKNPRQRRGQGGISCLIKKEIGKYVSIVKNDEHKCYIWLKIETPNALRTFVVGCTFLIKILTFMLVWIKTNLVLI